jgi:hypothetical protein
MRTRFYHSNQIHKGLEEIDSKTKNIGHFSFGKQVHSPNPKLVSPTNGTIDKNIKSHHFSTDPGPSLKQSAREHRTNPTQIPTGREEQDRDPTWRLRASESKSMASTSLLPSSPPATVR